MASNSESAANVPYEIWQQIASYLPANVIQNLFSVNRAFLNIALNARYKTIHIGEFTSPQALLSFQRLTDPNLAQRVGTLVLRPSHVQDPFIRSRSTVPTKVKKWISIGPTKGVNSFPTELTKEIIENMSRVIHFTIESSVNEFASAFPLSKSPASLVHTGWKAFGSSLQSIELSVPLEVFLYSGILSSPESSMFPNLRKLVLRLSCTSSESKFNATGVTRTSLVPLINNHSSLLESLTLAIETNAFDLRIFFSSLNNLDRLEHLVVSQHSPASSNSPSGCSALLDFLVSRSPNLKHLEVHGLLGFHLDLATVVNRTRGTGVTPHHSASLKPLLPQLVAFRVQVWEPTNSMNAFQPLLLYFTDGLKTLQKLELANIRLTFDQIKIFLSSLNLAAELSTLEICACVLDTQLLELLSNHLPRLRTLRLCYENLRPSVYITNPFSIPSVEFGSALDATSFADWNLQHLFIRPFRAPPFMSCRWPIANAFPNVETINGYTRAEYMYDKAYMPTI